MRSPENPAPLPIRYIDSPLGCFIAIIIDKVNDIESGDAPSYQMRRRTSRMDPTKARNGWHDLVEELRSDIILGRRHPRERLIEDEIIAASGATRHSVRRAFDELERLGLAERLHNRGIRVRDYTPAEVEHLYEIRDCLERQAARKFTAPAGAALVEELRELAERHAQASREGDFAEIFARNDAFHRCLYAAAGNPPLAQAIEHYTIATQPIRTRAFPMLKLRELAVAEHAAMVELIAAGDGAALADCISAHIQGPKQVYLESIVLL
jgi:DNA-binding GntR family transcriptional regulator